MNYKTTRVAEFQVRRHTTPKIPAEDSIYS